MPGRSSILLAIAFLAAALAPVVAQARGDGSAQPPAYVDYEISGKLFRVPEPYIDVPPAREQLGRLNTRQQGFGVAFWLSDRKPSPLRVPSLNTYYPRETGRPASGDQDFIVAARTVTYLPSDVARRSVLPSQRLANMLKTNLFQEGNRIEFSIHGLNCYRTTVPSQHAILCATPAGASVDVLLSIGWDLRDFPNGPPNPSWGAHVFSKSDGLSMFLSFPDVLNRWSDVICETLSLVRSWQMPPDRSGDGCATTQASAAERRPQ